MVDRSKSLVTRGALERVLARASELQGASGDATEPADNLTEAQVLELGKEVGLSPEHIRQALAEERARIEPLTLGGSGVAYRLFGANRVAAQRVVRGTPERLFGTLDRWMEREEWLRVVRQRPDRRVWEPRRGILGSLRRLFGARGAALYRANDIAATVVPVDDEFSLVRLEADFTVLRNTMASQTAAGTVVGAAASTALAFMGVILLPVVLAPVVLTTGAAYANARRVQRTAVARAQLALEQVLDRLERGDIQTPSLLRMIELALPPR
jgi:hypothetical protein